MARQNKAQGRRFRITVADYAEHKLVKVFKFSALGLFLTVLSGFVLVAAGVICLIAFTPAKTLIPGYPDEQTRATALSNAIKIDSLETMMSKWELYSANLMNVLNGTEPVLIDSIRNATREKKGEADLSALEAQDSLLRQQVQESSQFNLSGGSRRSLQIEGIHFFVPVSGVVHEPFDAISHPYLALSAAGNVPVKAILDGTVVNASWENDCGYTVVLQHSGEIISTFRHCSKLLAKTGDKVKAGAVIAMTPDPEDLATGGHIHFELWYKGVAADPAQYISFQ